MYVHGCVHICNVQDAYMYIYIIINVYTRVCIYICTYKKEYTCKRNLVHADMRHACIRTCIYRHTYLDTHIYALQRERDVQMKGFPSSHLHFCSLYILGYRRKKQWARTDTIDARKL